MKNLKKLAGYILCLALVIGCISGCGGFAGKSDEELLMSSITSGYDDGYRELHPERK